MSEIRKTTSKNNVTVDSLIVGEFQKVNTITAMLRQTVTTESVYPSAIHSNSMQSNIFDAQEFSDTEKKYSSPDKRVAFMDVPKKLKSGEVVTTEMVQERIAEGACLYKILSNAPILADTHLSAIGNGQTTKAKIARGQLVRYGADDAKAGEVIMHLGKVQYRKVFFSGTPVADEDRRGSSDHEEYIYPELQAELSADPETGEITDELELVAQEVDTEDNQKM